MKEINDILQEFDPITLQEMDNVKLMDRTDTKFVFTLQQLPFFLKQMKEDYRVLEVAHHRISRYESLYYDTPDFDLYYNHHRGRTNRFKIRFRKYVESNLHFFEVKFKNNKSRTIKDRVKQDSITNTLHHTAQNLLMEKTPLTPEGLEAKLWINYSRITFVNKNTPERVTIDLDLTFVHGDDKKTVDNLVIAEVKQDKASRSAFLHLMKKYHIREGSISKYCFGALSMYSNLKHNNFKPNLILLKKILNGTLARNY